MGKTPFMPLWVADFLADVQDLDAREIGAYMLLLMSMWQRGGGLPDDQKKLQRVARVGRGWDDVWASIEGYFEVENGVITNARLTKELEKARTKSTVNTTSGARGGRAKALKYNNAPLANATVSLKQPEPYPELEGTIVPLPPVSPPKPEKARLPEGWVPTDAMVNYAHSQQLNDPEIQEIADDFHAYWSDRTDAQGRKSERGWEQTWRNRIRDVGWKFKRNRQSGPSRSTGHDALMAGFGAVAHRDG